MEKKVIFTKHEYCLVDENGVLNKYEFGYNLRLMYEMVRKIKRAGLLLRKTEYFTDGTFWTEPLDVQKNLIVCSNEMPGFANAVEVDNFAPDYGETSPAENFLIDYNSAEILSVDFFELWRRSCGDDFVEAFTKAAGTDCHGIEVVTEKYYNSGLIKSDIPKLWILFDEPSTLDEIKKDGSLTEKELNLMEKEYSKSKFIYKKWEYLYPVEGNYVVMPRSTEFKEIEYAR